MAANQEVTARKSTAVDERKTRAPEAPMLPAVDIFEDAYQITVQAEMPGVSKDRLNVQAHHNELLIEGDVQLDMPAGMTAFYADLQTTKYRRRFVLSGELETDRIAASLKDGVLTVRIPKRAEFRTRRIKVDAQ